MALDYTVDALVDRVRRTAQLKTDNAKLSTAEIIQVIDETIQQELFPRLMTVRDDYQMVAHTIVLTAGISEYRLPFQAASSTIDHVEAVQFNGVASGVPIGASVLPRVEVPQTAAWLNAAASASNAQMASYVIAGDTIKLLPTPDTNAAQNYILRVWHEWRPSRLIEKASCAVISSAVANASPLLITATLSAVLPANLNQGDGIDIVPSQPPLMPLVLDGSITSDATDPIIVISAGYSQVRDQALFTIQNSPLPYLTPTGYTCVFPLPDAWFSACVWASAAAVCNIVGDGTGMEKALAVSVPAIENLVQLQSNRVRKQPHALFDRESPMRRAGWFFGGNRGGGGV